MWDYWQKLPPEKNTQLQSWHLPNPPLFHLQREVLVHLVKRCLATERQLSCDSFYIRVSWQEVPAFYSANDKPSSALHRKAPRRRWSWAGRSPPSSPTSPSGRSCWRRRRRRSSRRRWCSRGTSWRRPTRSPPLWGRRRPTPAVTNPSRWAAAFRAMKHILHRFKKRRVFLWRYESFPAPPDGDWLALPDIPPHVRVEDFLPHLSLTFFPHLISARRSVEKWNYAHSFTHFNLFFFFLHFYSLPFPSTFLLLLARLAHLFLSPLINQHQLLPGLLSG